MNWFVGDRGWRRIPIFGLYCDRMQYLILHRSTDRPGTNIHPNLTKLDSKATLYTQEQNHIKRRRCYPFLVTGCGAESKFWGYMVMAFGWYLRLHQSTDRSGTNVM